MSAVVQPRPTLAAPATWSFPDIEHRTAGDLDVHVLDLPGRGLASVDLRLDAPVTADPEGVEGLALLTARALDEGSSSRDANDFAAALDRIGADLTAGAGTTGMHVSLDVPAGNLAAALDLLAEAAGHPVFPAREVDRLVAQRLDAIRQQLAQPAQRTLIAQRQVMLDGHRCALPNGGTLDTVPSITRDLASKFHGDHARTGPATLVVAGDLAGLDVVDLAGSLLGRWVVAQRPAHEPVPVEPHAGPRVVVIDKPGAVQTQLLIGRAGPDRHADDWVETRVAAYVLGGTLTSRLDIILREDKGYTYGVRSRLDGFRRGGVVQLLSGSVDTEHTGESVRIGLDRIAELAAGGPTDDEVATAVHYLVGVRPLSMETPAALVSEVARNLGQGLEASHTDRELAAMRALTRDQVAAAAARWLDPADATIVAVGDAGAIVADLQAIGHADVEVQRD
jgi:predicted Zn-dependent peptidase